MQATTYHSVTSLFYFLGGSLAKIAYVHAADGAQTGHLHLISFPVSETEKVLENMKTTLGDLTAPGDVIYGTGFGSQRLQAHISDLLNIRCKLYLLQFLQ